MKFKKIVALILAGALCVSAFTGCGSAKPDETVATLGETTITFDMANFLCKYQKATVDDLYIMYFGGPAWDYDVTGSGQTLEEDLKESVMGVLRDLYTLKAHIADYNVVITPEDEAAIEEAAHAFIESNTAEAIEEFGATEDLVKEVLTLYTIQAKMFDAMTTDVDRVVSDEEANMRGYSYVSIGLEGEYKSDSYVKYTDAEKAKLREKASNIEKALKEGADFATVAKENDLTVSKSAYKKGDTTIGKELCTALDALKEGEVSAQVVTDTTIYFVKLDAETDKDATESNRESIIAERENERFNEILDGWQKDDGWSVKENVVDKIDFHNLFTQSTETSEGEVCTEDHDHSHDGHNH